jgi:hypothetical protein
VTYASHGTEPQHLKGQFWIERRAKEISQHEVEGEFNSMLRLTSGEALGTPQII